MSKAWNVLQLLSSGFLFPAALPAQEEALVEQLAPVLAAEDARHWQPEVFRRALVAPDSVVRRIAAFAAGRIGDLRATPLLLPLMGQPDSTVRIAAAFALGLLRDSSALEPLIQRLTGLPALDTATAAEAVTAIAKIGGKRSGEFFGAVLAGRVALSQADPQPATSQILLESWRLGSHAPTDALLPFASDTNVLLRWRAVYSLGRLGAPGAANHLIAALRSDDAGIRALAARALTRDYASAAQLASASVSRLLSRAVDDGDAGVRVNALRSLASYGDSTFAALIASRLEDPNLHVRLQAAASLGELKGSVARDQLQRAARGDGSFALRREALLGLARVDPATFDRTAGSWRSDGDWRSRAAAAEGWGRAGARGSPWFSSDADGRVIAAGLQAWADAFERSDTLMIQTARRLLNHPDAAVRSVAADIVARAADPGDLPALARMYTRSLRDSFPDASLSALNAILALRQRGGSAQVRVDREFLQTSQRPDSYLIRDWAETNWPEAAARWGATSPIATGRSMQDYRDIVRRLILAPDSVARPRIFIDTEQRGILEVELLGPEAPLTVANFMQLVDRRFFDGNRWHRVVPNFVVQDGDPRGDGFGSPGGAIRDEINPNRYGTVPMMGMALSGPDTGSSQWFITLGPQPHLDGTYTVFGRVQGSTAVLSRITQGDVIRTVRR
jgi:cyclophilin family peptidyl-prolyl cis-trans isomerase/HEAT repeat protein